MKRLLLFLIILYLIYLYFKDTLYSFYNQYKNSIWISIIGIIGLYAYFNQKPGEQLLNRVIHYVNKVDTVPVLSTYQELDQIVQSYNRINSDQNILRGNEYNYTNNNMKKKNKRNVSETKKKYVASMQSWKCAICYQVLDASYEVDHIHALYKGGTNKVDNLRALCRNCHGKKTVSDRIT